MRQDEWLKKKMNVDVHQYTRDIAKLGFKPLYFPKRAVIKVDDYLLDLTEGTITLKGKRVCEYTGKRGFMDLLKLRADIKSHKRIHHETEEVYQESK